MADKPKRKLMKEHERRCRRLHCYLDEGPTTDTAFCQRVSRALQVSPDEFCKWYGEVYSFNASMNNKIDRLITWTYLTDNDFGGDGDRLLLDKLQTHVLGDKVVDDLDRQVADWFAHPYRGDGELIDTIMYAFADILRKPNKQQKIVAAWRAVNGNVGGGEPPTPSQGTARGERSYSSSSSSSERPPPGRPLPVVDGANGALLRRPQGASSRSSELSDSSELSEPGEVGKRLDALPTSMVWVDAIPPVQGQAPRVRTPSSKLLLPNTATTPPVTDGRKSPDGSFSPTSHVETWLDGCTSELVRTQSTPVPQRASQRTERRFQSAPGAVPRNSDGKSLDEQFDEILLAVAEIRDGLDAEQRAAATTTSTDDGSRVGADSDFLLGGGDDEGGSPSYTSGETSAGSLVETEGGTSTRSSGNDSSGNAGGAHASGGEAGGGEGEHGGAGSGEGAGGVGDGGSGSGSGRTWPKAKFCAGTVLALTTGALIAVGIIIGTGGVGAVPFVGTSLAVAFAHVSASTAVVNGVGAGVCGVGAASTGATSTELMCEGCTRLRMWVSSSVVTSAAA